MRFTRFVGTTNRDPVYRAALREGRIRKVDLRPAQGNLTLDFRIDGQPLALPMTPVVRDLVDLAAMVYAADELSLRSHASDGWSRAFRSGDSGTQSKTLAHRRRRPARHAAVPFGRHVQFRLEADADGPALRSHRATIAEGFDTVCLFSGGADSLVGAYGLLADGKAVLLVGHQADGITASAQNRVVQFLQRRFSGRVALVQARVARSLRAEPEFDLGPKVETTHRPRSFLFLLATPTSERVSSSRGRT